MRQAEGACEILFVRRIEMDGKEAAQPLVVFGRKLAQAAHRHDDARREAAGIVQNGDVNAKRLGHRGKHRERVVGNDKTIT